MLRESQRAVCEVGKAHALAGPGIVQAMEELGRLAEVD